jgi:hypothetical protein
MKMVDGDLVCGRYPYMSHSGKGVRCIDKGCMKYVQPVKGEQRELQCVFHHFKELKNASIQDVSMMDCREVCAGAMVRTPNYAAMTLSCSMSQRESGL